MPNTLTFGTVKAVRVQDLMVKEIVESNNWQRPIYFAVTCSDDSRIGLGDYLKMEGMAYRLVPEKRPQNGQFINEEVLNKELIGTKKISKDFLPGFKFRGLNDENIFFDDNQRRMVQNYRNAFIQLSIYYLNQQKNDKVITVLDEMESKLPYKLLGIDNGLLFEIGNLYKQSGAMDRYKSLAVDIEKNALDAIKQNPGNVQSYYNPYRILLETYDNLGEYEKALGIWQNLKEIYPNDPSIDAGIKKYQNLVAQKDSLPPGQ